MPRTTRALTLGQVRDHVDHQFFRPSAARRLVGVETEWHVVRAADPHAEVPLDELRQAMRPFTGRAGRSVVTYEPGGQLELSSLPADDVGAVVRELGADLARVEDLLAPRGIELLGAGVDPRRRPGRQLSAPRYDAMEEFFDADGPNGRVMMTRTASVQVNLDNGGSADAIEQRWRRVHAIGPALVASFASSPLACGRPTSWRSTRLANWWSMDPSRTRPVALDGPAAQAWSEYVLDARVMLLRLDDGRCQPVLDGMRMRDWIENGHALGHPTVDDLDYHLTTLFPPVRPRGWFELRYLDAVPAPWWPVVAAITTMLVDDDEAGALADAATAETAGRWMVAAGAGLTDDRLAAAASSCFDAALAALDRRGADRPLRDLCGAYADRFVSRRRCPADELLEGWCVQRHVGGSAADRRRRHEGATCP